MAYDGHKGTDFALPTHADMDKGIPVLAAAPGTVAAIRNTMPDTGLSADSQEVIAGRECGNGILVEHPGGWETQYCHLKQGSVLVRPGQAVSAGTPLGLIGLSGRTEFPHLHLSVRKDGTTIDPFAPSNLNSCGAETHTLWNEPPPYKQGGLLELRFTNKIPDFSTVKQGGDAIPQLTPNSDALILYAYGYGSRKGDELRLDITGPDGPILRRALTLRRTQALWFRALGKGRRGNIWSPGTYSGTAELWRDNSQISKHHINITLP